MVWWHKVLNPCYQPSGYSCRQLFYSYRSSNRGRATFCLKTNEAVGVACVGKIGWIWGSIRSSIIRSRTAVFCQPKVCWSALNRGLQPQQKHLILRTLHAWRQQLSMIRSRCALRHACLFLLPVCGIACFRRTLVLCSNNRLIGQKDVSHVVDPPFNWRKFLKLMSPEMWYLLMAIICALLVAVLNVQIPLMLGEVINVISNLQQEEVAQYLNQLKQPTVKLLCLYCAQGFLTCIYIWMLSCAGERVASRMRKELFSNLVRQDIQFFDANKVGELINRLTTDVQDFKSSFKLCISQGLRALTQTAGCIISLIFISPRLTVVMVIVLPSVILIGSLMGSHLRIMSKEASAQLARSTSVADEALGNVRTVRAFAMENKEIELYDVEVDKSCSLNEQLGFGIGVFQGLSNCVLNCTVLGILYVGGTLMASSQIKPGDLMSFLVASQTIQRSLSQLSILFGQAVRGLGAGSRVLEYLALECKMPMVGGNTPDTLVGNVEFKDVTFAYPTRPDKRVLEDFNLKIPGGKVVALCGLSGGGTVLGILYVGGTLMASSQIKPGDLMSFLVASQTIQRSLSQLSILFGQAVRGLGAGSRVLEYLALECKMPMVGGNTPDTLVGNVEFKDVTFAYPTRPDKRVLEDFNLKIPGGKVVALCGLSGGGKSTVAVLLERFYEVDKGMIAIDGKDIKSLDPSWLRGRAIGFINQEPVLFATSVRENIRYGRPEASDQQVEDAARLANAHEFICGFPESYGTILGERGVTISGGQKQRIAIARALLKNPSILILDEATSALDAESERVVQEALDRVIKDRTTLVIAHRLSTIQNADIIAVVADGEVAEMGSHTDLLKKKGLYYELIKQQQVEHQVEKWIHTHSHHHHGDYM